MNPDILQTLLLAVVMSLVACLFWVRNLYSIIRDYRANVINLKSVCRTMEETIQEQGKEITSMRRFQRIADASARGSISPPLDATKVPAPRRVTEYGNRPPSRRHTDIGFTPSPTPDEMGLNATMMQAIIGTAPSPAVDWSDVKPFESGGGGDFGGGGASASYESPPPPPAPEPSPPPPSPAWE